MKIKPYCPEDPGFHPQAGMLHWDYDWGDAIHQVHLFGYSDWFEIPFGGYDLSQEQPTMELAEACARMWAAAPLGAAVCCGWCNGFDTRPRTYRPNEYRGRNLGPANLTWPIHLPWPTAVYVGHIIVWPDWPP